LNTFTLHTVVFSKTLDIPYQGLFKKITKKGKTYQIIFNFQGYSYYALMKGRIETGDFSYEIGRYFILSLKIFGLNFHLKLSLEIYQIYKNIRFTKRFKS